MRRIVTGNRSQARMSAIAFDVFAAGGYFTDSSSPSASAPAETAPVPNPRADAVRAELARLNGPYDAAMEQAAAQQKRSLPDEIALELEIMIFEDPDHAARIGADSQLFRDPTRAYVPRGPVQRNDI